MMAEDKDALELALDQLRVRGTSYFAKRLPQTYGVKVTEYEKLCRFHLVLSGETWINIPETGRNEFLNQYDFAIVPHGRTHYLRSAPDSEITYKEEIPGPVQPQTGAVDISDGATGLLCGYFVYADSTPSWLTTRLPDLLVLRSKDCENCHQKSIKSLVDFALSEISSNQIVSDLVLNRCAEILFLYALRHWIKTAVSPTGALSLFTDKRVNRAVIAILENPEKAWTVETLARYVGQSRTAFATSFKSELGLGPIEFLHSHRIELARRILVETDQRLDSIAAKVGYQDTSSFGRAFTRSIGLSPAQYRKAAR